MIYDAVDHIDVVIRLRVSTKTLKYLDEFIGLFLWTI